MVIRKPTSTSQRPVIRWPWGRQGTTTGDEGYVGPGGFIPRTMPTGSPRGDEGYVGPGGSIPRQPQAGPTTGDEGFVGPGGIMTKPGSWDRKTLYGKGRELVDGFKRGDTNIFGKFMEFADHTGSGDSNFARGLIKVLSDFSKGKGDVMALADIAEQIKGGDSLPRSRPSPGTGDEGFVGPGGYLPEGPTGQTRPEPHVYGGERFGTLSNQPRAPQPNIPNPASEPRSMPGRPAKPNSFSWRKRQPMWW